jgi:acyl-CoA thioesterase FadM
LIPFAILRLPFTQFTIHVFPWIRLIRTALTCIGKPRIDVLDTTCIRLRVWPNDLDLNLHVNNGRYLALADIARMHWFVRSGAVGVARGQRAAPIVGDAVAKFRRDLKPFQKFEIHSRMLGWDTRWGFMEHRFVRHGRVLGVVAVRGVFKGPNGPIAPQVFLDALGIPHAAPELPQWIVEWNSGCESLSIQIRKEEADQRP